LKILFLTDTHNADFPPRMRKASYMEDILAKQEALIEPAKKCDFCFHGGDIFHSKKAEKISHKLVNRILEIYREYPNMWIVPGNHDIDTQMNWSERPLGTLDKLPNISVKHASVLHEGDCDFLFFGGAEFFPQGALESWLKSLQLKKGKRHRVGVFHYSISDTSYPFSVLSPSSFSSYVDLMLLGHLHDYQVCSNYVVSPGGLSRGVLSVDTSLERQVCYAIVDITKGKVNSTLYNLPMKPVDEVFRMETKEKEVKEDVEIGTFLDYIDKFSLPKIIDKETLLKTIQEMAIEAPVKRTALRILEEL